MKRFFAGAVVLAVACGATPVMAQGCRTRTHVWSRGGVQQYDVRTSGQCSTSAVSYAYVSPVAPTPVYPVPQPIPVAPVVVAANPPVVDAPAHLAVKYLPGFSSAVALDTTGLAISTPRFAHSVGIEVRATHWLAFRSDLEMRGTSTSWDMLGLKLSVPTRVLSPFVSASLAGTSSAGSLSLGVSGALGLDLKIGKHLFFTAETRVRVTPDARACCGTTPQVVGLVGGGVAFF